MNKIRLHPNAQQQVMAKYLGPHAVEIERLFGTDVLPTPFNVSDTEDKNGVYVINKIRSLNPGVTVEWEQ